MNIGKFLKFCEDFKLLYSRYNNRRGLKTNKISKIFYRFSLLPKKRDIDLETF